MMYRPWMLDGPYRRYPRWEDQVEPVIWVVAIAGFIAAVMGWV